MLLTSILSGALSACQPEATPIPAVIPTPPTATPEPGATPVVRYALALNVPTPQFAETVGAEIRFEAVERIDPGMLGNPFDVLVAYDRPDWTQVSVMPRVSLLVNTNVSPLDDPAVVDALRRSIDPDELQFTVASGTFAEGTPDIPINDLRVEWASLGYPDGFDLTAASVGIASQNHLATLLMERFNIKITFVQVEGDDTVTALEQRNIHLGLAHWADPQVRTAWVTRLGEANVIDLYTLPLSYLAVDGLTITFSSDGFPIAQR